MSIVELENRLIRYSVNAVRLYKTLYRSPFSRHLGNQLMRSASSSALNFGEARGSESRRDHIHKMSIILKELRESYICLQIIQQADVLNNDSGITGLIKESNELIAIFVTSINTAKDRLTDQQ